MRYKFLALLGILAAMATTLGCPKQPDSEPILLEKGSIQGFVCQYKSKASGNCYHGFTKRDNCTKGCGIGTLPDFGRLKMAFEYQVTGRVVDDITEAPIEGMEVHLVLPNRVRYVARTHADGGFTLTAKPEAPVDTEAELVRQDVGVLRTVLAEAVQDETGKIGIVALFTDEFRASYPDLDYLTLPAATLEGRTIYLEGAAER